jgi:hypothetical protein
MSWEEQKLPPWASGTTVDARYKRGGGGITESQLANLARILYR